jgi:uncharacterized protein (DUF2267 family)
MSEHFQQTQSWSGLGVGTDKESFLIRMQQLIPELDPEEAAEAVFCALSERLSGGTVQRLLEQLPPDVRQLLGRCGKELSAHASGGDREDFYLAVAEHLLVDPEQVRRVLHAVFGALHSQITEAESERIVAELPDDISGTWLAARHAIPAPH